MQEPLNLKEPCFEAGTVSLHLHPAILQSSIPFHPNQHVCCIWSHPRTLTSYRKSSIQMGYFDISALIFKFQLEPSRYTYILPPIVYPNGRHYLKFGAHDLTRELLTKASLVYCQIEPIWNMLQRWTSTWSLQADVVNHYRIGPDPDHVRKLVCRRHVSHHIPYIPILQACEARLLIPKS